MCWDVFRWAKDVCLDPKKNTKKDYKYGDFIRKLVLVSLVSGVMMTLMTVFAFTSELAGEAGALGWASAFVFVPIFVLGAVFNPFVSGAIVHFFGKIAFKMMRKDFKKTYNAAAYSQVPAFLFGWIPVVGGAIGGIWSVIVYVYALSNQQGIKPGKALVVVLIPIIIAVAIAFVLAVAAASFIAGAMLGPGMMDAMFAGI